MTKRKKLTGSPHNHLILRIITPYIKFKPLVGNCVRFLLIVLILVLPTWSAQACGWWGDSEMSSRRDNAVISADGKSLEYSLNIATMKLPGRRGYGIAVPEPGRVSPYLIETGGQPLARIQDLQIFGFRSVIDLGPAVPEAASHRAETMAVGMGYFHIPITGNMPNPEQVDTFNRIIIDAHNGPLLVYAPRSELIGVMWASYRLSLGAPLSFALTEGRSLGLTQEQEINLQIRQ